MFSPQAGGAQKHFDKTWVVTFDESDNSHFSAAVRALKGINFVHALDKRCPGEPAFQLVFSKGFRRINRRIFNYGLSHAAFFIRVPAVVAYLMVSLVGH